MRRARWRRAVCSAAALACVLPLLVITPGAQARPSVEPPHGQITIGMPQFPDTLSPYQGDLPIDAQVQAGMFAPFAYLDGHGRLVPDLLADIPSVKNHQVLGGGRTVILRLKPHQYWSSGSEITSADVVFGWKVDRDPLTGPACAATGCMVRSMQATDPYTVVAKLSHLPPDDDLSWLPDLVPHGWKKLGRSPHAAARILYQDSSFNYEWPGPESWVSGPYRVRNVVNNDRVVLRISPESAGTKEPHVARLLCLFYAGDGDLIGALTSGAVDIATELLPADLPALRKAAPGNFRIIMRPTYDLEHLELNVGSTQFRGAPNPLTDVRVRQALALATDRAGLMRTVLHLGPEQIRSLSTYTPWLTSQNLAEPGADTAITGAWAPLAQRYVAYGSRALRDARTLLARAGFPQGLDLEMSSPTRPQDRRESAAFIAETWAQIGVRVGIEPNKKCPPIVGPCLAPLQFGDFEVAGVGVDAGPNPRLLEPWLVPPATPPSGYYEPCCLDPAGINDPQIERAWKRAASARTPAERNVWYRRIQERIVKQAYWIPLYWIPEISAVSPRIKGFGKSGEAPVWRPQDWRPGN